MSSTLTQDRSVWAGDRDGCRITACTTEQDIVSEIHRSIRGRYWVCQNSVAADYLIGIGVKHVGVPCCKQPDLGELLVVGPLQTNAAAVTGLFTRVIGGTSTFRWLPLDQLSDVLSSPMDEQRDLIIGGAVDMANQLLVLVRGSCQTVAVKLSVFKNSGKAKPDFTQLEIDDYGQTLRFGDYEASTDAVLWEADSDYRKRVKARERSRAEGFGPSLRRLRKQRGLSQSDFPGVTRKTISRIENGSVDKPHGGTLHAIASTLGVRPEEVESF